MTKELTRMQDARVQWVRDLAKCNLPYPGNSGLDGFAAGWDEGFACARAQDQAEAGQPSGTKMMMDRAPSIEEAYKEMYQSVATVIDNNQAGWTNIIETAPGVTLLVGTKLYLHPSPRATAEQNPVPVEGDDHEVLFALEMACEHDDRHQAMALRTWLPRIRQWYAALEAQQKEGK
jgi:hypothetical protein